MGLIMVSGPTYKVMWDELRAQLNKELEFYIEGSQCSFMESINGAANAENMLRAMDRLETKYCSEVS